MWLLTLHSICWEGYLRVFELSASLWAQCFPLSSVPPFSAHSSTHPYPFFAAPILLCQGCAERERERERESRRKCWCRYLVYDDLWTNVVTTVAKAMLTSAIACNTQGRQWCYDYHKLLWLSWTLVKIVIIEDITIPTIKQRLCLLYANKLT